MGNNLDKEDGGGNGDSGSSSNTPSNQRKVSQAGGGSTGSKNASGAGGAGGVNRLTMSQKDLIRQIWDSSKRTEICVRIYKRVFDKRPDMRKVFETMGEEAYVDEAKKFGEFLDSVVGQLDDLAAIERQSLELGRRHGEWRGFGFKSEFWVVFAESMTTECVYLDAGAHQTGEVLAAWSTLITMIFGWVRDGYYDQLKLQRKLSRKASRPGPTAASSAGTGTGVPPRQRSASRTNSGPLPDENADDQQEPAASNLIRTRPGSTDKTSPRLSKRT